jgi:hypothetical protein
MVNQKHTDFGIPNRFSLTPSRFRSGPCRVRIIFDHAPDFNFINADILGELPKLQLGRIASSCRCDRSDGYLAKHRHFAVRRSPTAANIFAYLQAAARRLRFRFPILSFMAPSTDFLLPRFETYSTGENAGLREVDHCRGLPWSSKALRTTERPPPDNHC